jgi:amidase
LGGIKVFMKAIASQQPWYKDPLAVRKPWNEGEYNLIDHGNGDKLCFAILWDDENMAPHPPVIRGLEETRQALVAAGHQVIDWKPLKHAEICRTASAVWSAGAAEDYRVSTTPSGEPVIANMSIEVEDTDSHTQITLFRPLSEGISAYNLWQVQKQKLALRQEYLDHWNSTATLTETGRPVDAIISPMAAYVATPHGKNQAAQYTTVWNVLDYTALTIPTGSYADESVCQETSSLILQ